MIKYFLYHHFTKSLRGKLSQRENVMYRIVEKKVLNPTVIQLHIEAPLVANKAKPGQFIILRVDEEGERIPLTIAGVNKELGTVKIIFQVVGGTTKKLSYKEAGEYIQDFVGPLGGPTHLDGLGKVCIVGGGSCGFAKRLVGIPIRAFHGLRDRTVYPVESLEMVRRVNLAGGYAELILFPECEHNIWEKVYGNEENYDWLLSFTNEREKTQEESLRGNYYG